MFKILICIIAIIYLQVLYANEDELIDYIRSLAVNIESENDLDPLIQAAGEKQFVLLGEASHGTSEYYLWRSKISKRLIEEKGFSFIAVEGDWTAAYEVNKYIKNLPGAGTDAREVLASFDRWPPWMWNNREIKELVTWLREYNMNRPEHEQVGFYGIDVYAMWDSIHEVIGYFQSQFPEKTDDIRGAYNCILAFDDDPQGYAVTIARGHPGCRDGIEEAVAILRNYSEELIEIDRKLYFNAKQNALVAKHAERHYRAMIDRGPDSWNYRVRNFKRTVEYVSGFFDNAKGIVWAHNTHVGDARATPMANQGMENIGYLLRQKYGHENVFIVGFGTYRGSVLAGSQWGAPVETMIVPEAIEGSLGKLFNKAGISKGLFVFPDNVPEALMEPRGHRAKGVVYNPQNERGNYVPTILPQRYDAFIFIEETGPLSPL